MEDCQCLGRKQYSAGGRPVANSLNRLEPQIGPRPDNATSVPILSAAKLTLIKLLIRFTSTQQFIVLSLADDLAPIHDHNRVGPHDRAEAMGDHKRRPLVKQAVDRLLDQMLALGVDLAGRFIENEDG